MAELACDVHGFLRRRMRPYSGPDPEPVWACLGWDGEGRCHLADSPVPATARERLLAGATYWPGVGVVDGGTFTSWTQARDKIRGLLDSS